MDNYEYIIASLPTLHYSQDRDRSLDPARVLSEIREQLSTEDNALLDFTLRGFEAESLNADFYSQALKSRCRFIREYFLYDLQLRNLKVGYLNSQLGRSEDSDLLVLEQAPECEADTRDEILQALSCEALLERERALDRLLWAKAESITELDIFNINLILSFTVRLKITDRWLKLDEKTGKELFRKLVDEIRSTYDNKKQNLI
ncbi:MAG: DUF2764 family protein [Bacteroidales bacterium]|nr:DUF2764 family protein [Bacteroidales bacterium]